LKAGWGGGGGAPRGGGGGLWLFGGGGCWARAAVVAAKPNSAATASAGKTPGKCRRNVTRDIAVSRLRLAKIRRRRNEKISGKIVRTKSVESQPRSNGIQADCAMNALLHFRG
jgi:hypothetical protein